MKNIETFLSELSDLDIKLWVEGDKLRCQASKGTLTPELRAELAERKIEILQFLQQTTSEPAIQPIPREQALPLSFAQQRLWFIDKLGGKANPYNIGGAIRLEGTLHRAALEQSLQEIVQRHESLRTCFPTVNGAPVVQLSEFRVQLAVINLLSSSPDEQAQEVQSFINDEAQRPFDLSKGPLFRTILLQLGIESHILLLNIHHIISDGWSIGVFFRELSILYRAFSQDQPSPLPALPIQYVDFAHWQRQWLSGERLKTRLSYWQQQLADAPQILDIPSDHLRPSVYTFRGGYEEFKFSPKLTQQLKSLSQQSGATLFMITLAAFAILIARYTGQEEFLLGSGIANRNRKDIEPLIGFFVNILALRLNLSGNPTFRALLKRVQQVTLEAYANQDVPFEQVVETIQPERDLSRNPLVQVSLVFQNTPMPPLKLKELTLSPLEIESDTVRFDIECHFWEVSDKLMGRCFYYKDLFEATTITRMLAHFQTLFTSIVTEPEQPLSALSILSDAERQQLLIEWNDTATAYPQDKCLHQLFEAQVERTPDAIAVVFEDQHLSYVSLNEKANQLAHYLQHIGIKPEVFVGICVARSLEMVYGLLGILKAGGAYLPLDPALPSPRLTFLLTDAKAPVLLTQKNLLEEQLDHLAQVICLDTDWKKLSAEPLTNPLSPVQPEHLAYMIYTSGSTGQPKGVLIEHRGAVNTLIDINQRFSIGPQDRVLALSALNFDLSVYDIFGLLAVGGTVIIPKALAQATKDPTHWLNLMTQHQVTVWNTVPALMQMLVDYLSEQPPSKVPNSLRLALMSGDWIPLNLPGRLKTLWPQAQIISLGGATEASIWSIHYPIAEIKPTWKSIPYGKPLANQTFYVLDKSLAPCPLLAPGYLYIGGVGLARGYWRDEDKTQASFILHPHLHQRLYKTGDLGRYLPDGNIEFLGRRDNQVKLRGFRLELGEIETFLTQHPAVFESMVVAHEESLEHKRLIAYMVLDPVRAFSVLQQLHKENLFKDKLRYDLPNGMTITHLNPTETQFVYQEIFEERHYLKHGIMLNEGDCVFDVGANIGLFTLFVAQECNNNVTIYAFEPIPAVVELLRLNTEIYGIKANVFDCGLSNEIGRDTFTYYPHISIISGRFANETEEREVIKSFTLKQQQDANTPSFTLSNEKIDELLTERLESLSVTCQLRTLSEVMAENDIQKIDLLKIVVEKSELDILSGINENDWPKIRQLIVEVHNIDNRLETISNLLKEHGYELTIEQDVLLEKVELYNIYAIRPNASQPPTSAKIQNISEPDVKNWHSLAQLIKDVRCFLNENLPDYMIPSAFIPLKTWPLTSNGKIDRKALPKPEGQDTGSTYVAPQTEIEHQIVDIWKAILHTTKVGIHDNFFDLGGNSLLLMQVQSQLVTVLHQDVPVVMLFQYPTIQTLAHHLENSDHELTTFQTTYDRAAQEKRARQRHRERRKK